jgi:malonyl-CoA O-methyltransferase
VGSLRDHWHEHAEAWSLYARAPGHDRAHEELNLPSFLTLLPPTPARVLDLGCGEGRVGAVLVERGYDVVGVDSSETMAALARERHEAVCADAADLPFDGGSFDIVTSYMSLFNMDDMPGAVAEAARVLRPGGHLFICELHPYRQLRGGQAHFEDTETNQTVPVTAFQHSVSEYVNGALAAGFVVRALGEHLEESASPDVAPRLLSVLFER